MIDWAGLGGTEREKKHEISRAGEKERGRKIIKEGDRAGKRKKRKEEREREDKSTKLPFSCVCGEILRRQHEALNRLVSPHNPRNNHLFPHTNIPNMSGESVHFNASSLRQSVPELVPPIKLGTDNIAAFKGS